MATVVGVHDFVAAVAVVVAVAVEMMMEDEYSYNFGDWSEHVDGPMLLHGVIPSAYSSESLMGY